MLASDIGNGPEAMRESSRANDTRGPGDVPGRFIPVRKRELVDAVLAHPGVDPAARPGLAALAQHLALIFHIEFFGKRDRLKDAYIRFSPDHPDAAMRPPDPEARNAFLDELHQVLMAANFHLLTEAEIAAGRKGGGKINAPISVPKDLFDEVRFYGRGRGVRPITVEWFFGLREKAVAEAIYHEIVFVCAPRHTLPTKAVKRVRLRPGTINLKLFRDIPEADLLTLYPDARVVMSIQDRLLLGVPALVGGIPLLLKIVPTMTVLFVVIGAYLGVSGVVEGDAMKRALAALSGLGALVGFVMTQWIKYERQKLKYQKQVADHAYFNMTGSNGGLFDALIGASEDSEVKEAYLAYAFLLMAEAPLTAPELDSRIEHWLTETFRVRVDFEIEDAMGKLTRLGLVTETDRGLAATPVDVALARCEGAWQSLTGRALEQQAPQWHEPPAGHAAS